MDEDYEYWINDVCMFFGSDLPDGFDWKDAYLSGMTVDEAVEEYFDPRNPHDFP